MPESRIIRSGRDTSALAMASRPLLASMHTTEPGFSSALRRVVLTAGQSSTIRTVGISAPSDEPKRSAGRVGPRCGQFTFPDRITVSHSVTIEIIRYWTLPRNGYGTLNRSVRRWLIYRSEDNLGLGGAKKIRACEVNTIRSMADFRVS